MGTRSPLSMAERILSIMSSSITSTAPALELAAAEELSPPVTADRAYALRYDYSNELGADREYYYYLFYGRGTVPTCNSVAHDFHHGQPLRKLNRSRLRLGIVGFNKEQSGVIVQFCPSR